MEVNNIYLKTNRWEDARWEDERVQEAIRNDPRMKKLIGEDMPYVLEKTEGGYFVKNELVNFKVEVYSVPGNAACPSHFGLRFPIPL